MRYNVFAILLLAACATQQQGPRQIAKAECSDWLGRHNLMQRPERGSKDWDQLVGLCIAKHLGAAGEIDRAIQAQN